MNCCMCNGSCCHVGPHSYCAAHGGTYQPIQQFPPLVPYFPPYVPPVICNHCWCLEIEAMDIDKECGPHRRCCKCLDTMAEEFLNVNKTHAAS